MRARSRGKDSESIQEEISDQEEKVKSISIGTNLDDSFELFFSKTGNEGK